VRGRGSTFSTKAANKWRRGCQAYALATLYPKKNFWHSFLLEAESTLNGKVREEELHKLKNPMALSGIEPATF
jgi:hypothetical protein